MGKAIEAAGKYVRRHHVGLLALFVALGGTAFAVTKAPKNSVVSKSIKANAVRSSDIKNLAVGPHDLSLARTVTLAGPVSITDLNPGTVTRQTSVEVGRTGLVSVYLRAELQKTTGTACLGHVRITAAGGQEDEALVLFEDININSSVAGAPYPDAPSRMGRGVGGWVVLESDPGTRAVSFRLSRSNASCIFRDVRLVAVPVS